MLLISDLIVRMDEFLVDIFYVDCTIAQKHTQILHESIFLSASVVVGWIVKQQKMRNNMYVMLNQLLMKPVVVVEY